MKYKINKSISSLFLVFVTVLTVMSCDNKKNNSTTIIGLITGNYKGQTISITEINNDLDDVAIDTIASASIKKGTFKFSNLKVNDPRAAKLTFGDTINTVFFLEP